MFDWIGEAVSSVTVYALVRNHGGLLLMLLSGVGVVVFLWRTLDATSYRFTWRRAIDLWAMLMITAAFAVGAAMWWWKG